MHPTLRREIGFGGAIVTGLGSILGTGAFVAIGLASGMWGDNVLLAIPMAGGLATFNGLSSAFLAGRFPVAVPSGAAPRRFHQAADQGPAQRMVGAGLGALGVPLHAEVERPGGVADRLDHPVRGRGQQRHILRRPA